MIRFGTVGTSEIADKFIRAGSLHPEFHLTAVCSRTAETAGEFARRHGAAQIFTSPEDMAESRSIDAVYIATPNALHCRQSLAFLRRGIAVLCEKPLACSYKEAAAMVAESQKNATLLMHAQKDTATPQFLAMKENLHRVGKVRMVTGTRCQYSSRYDDFKDGIIQNAFRAELGGGAMMDLGIYLVYPLVHLLGMPKRVRATAHLLSTGVDGAGALLLDYESMVASLSFSKISATHAASEIQGEKGTLCVTFGSMEPSLRFVPIVGPEESIPFQQIGHSMYYQVAEFISLLNRGKSSPDTINRHKDDLISMKIIDEYRRQVGVRYPCDAGGKAD